MKRFRPRHVPNPSLAISIIALIVAIGGTSYAALRLPPGSVGTKQLQKNAVVASKIKKDAVVAGKLHKAAVTAPKLKDDAVTAPKIGDGAVESSALANSAVSSRVLQPDSVGEAALGPNSVGEEAIQNGAVTAPALAPNAVTSGAIQNGAVTGEKVEAGSLTSEDFAPGELPGETVSLAGFQSYSISSGSDYKFIGPTPTVTTTADQGLVGSAVASMYSDVVGGQEIAAGLCSQPSGGGQILPLGAPYGALMVAVPYVAIPPGGAGQLVPASATVKPGAGSWKVGYCVMNNTGHYLTGGEYVTGWIQIAN